MNALIHVTTNEQGSQVVSARELYAYLQLAEGQFTRWAKSNIEDNAFALEGIDYQRFDMVVETPNGGKKAAIEYAVKLDFAKKLCMVSKSAKAEEVRDYFLECERRAKATPALSQLDILVQSVQLLQQQARELEEVKETVRQIDARTQTRPDYFTVAGYANLNRITIGLKAASSVGQKASMICRQRGYPMETTPDPRFGTVNMYPSNVLKEVFNQPL